MEKEFDGAAGAILRWISNCEIPSIARCPAVDSYLYQIPFNGTLHDSKGFLLVSISVSFCDLGVEHYTGPC